MPFAGEFVATFYLLSEGKTARLHHLYQFKLTSDDNIRLESSIRVALAEGNHQKIAKTVHQLCHDFAYAVHQPHARNGGLIGLAAAAIALGPVRLL